MSQVERAKELFDTGRLYEALDVYLELKKLIGSTAFDLNIKKIESILERDKNSNHSNITFGEALAALGVEKVYVVNLEKRPDRKLRMPLPRS